MSRPDLLLLGGGLASGLIARALTEHRPEVSFLVLERGPSIGGNHTWCFHPDDLGHAEAPLVEPAVGHRWPVHSVIFPGLGHRRIDAGYLCVPSERFHAALAPRLRGRVRFGAEIVEVTPTSVRLGSGEVIEAGAVIDARGAAASPHVSLGFQKFCGLEVLLEAPVALDGPVIMDATVPQEGGFRFVYTLPFAPDRVLIEATSYANSPQLPAGTFASDVLAYASARGWKVAKVIREEKGVLPITLAGDVHAFWKEARGVPRAGLRAGLFHQATGYSLPEAARLATLVARTPDLSAPALFATIRDHAIRRWRAQGFYRGINRMLFLAAEPERRVSVFGHFYRLPAPLISRFYAGQSTVFDKVRILSGKPPVPIPHAVGALARRHPIGASA
jgi:lycopene beta-cyclase